LDREPPPPPASGYPGGTGGRPEGGVSFCSGVPRRSVRRPHPPFRDAAAIVAGGFMVSPFATGFAMPIIFVTIICPVELLLHLLR
jgi:hypothetical protein